MAKRTRKTTKPPPAAASTSSKAVSAGAYATVSAPVPYMPTDEEIASALDFIRAVPQLRLNYEVALRSNTVSFEVCAPLEEYMRWVYRKPDSIKDAVSGLMLSDKDLELSSSVRALLEEIITTSEEVAAAAVSTDNWVKWCLIKINLLCHVLTRVLEAMRSDFDSAGSLLDRIGSACDTLIDDPSDRAVICVLAKSLLTVKNRGMPRSRDSRWATKYFYRRTIGLPPTKEVPASKRGPRRLKATLHTPWLPRMAPRKLTAALAWVWADSASLPDIAKHLSKLLKKPSGKTLGERAIKGWFKKELWQKNRPDCIFTKDLDDRTHHVRRELVIHVLKEKGLI